MAVNIATGSLNLDYADVSLPGVIPLVWTRRYSTDLIDYPTCLGRGWITESCASLTRTEEGFLLVGTTGGSHVIADPGRRVEAGNVVQDLANSQELFAESGRFVIQRWNHDSHEVSRLVFSGASRDSSHLLTGITDLTGNQLTMLRDANGRLEGIRQERERRTLRLSYGIDGLVSSLDLESPSGRLHHLVRYEYGPDGLLASVTNSAGFSDRFFYDTKSRLTRISVRDGGVFVFQFDSKGRCVRSSGIDGYDEKILRYIDSISRTEVTNSYGARTGYNYLPSGQIYSVQNALGAETRTEYDEYGRILSITTPDSARTEYAYDKSGNRCFERSPSGLEQQFEFNAIHQPVRLTDNLGRTWNRQYDASNRLCRSAEPTGATWSLEYDSQGNLIRITNPKGACRAARSENGLPVEVSDWLGNVTRLQFDDFGRLIKRSGPDGQITSTSYDALGNPNKVHLANGTTIIGTYDHAGNLTQVVDGTGATTRFGYGPCNRLAYRLDATGKRMLYQWGSEPGFLDRIVNEKGEFCVFTRNAIGLVVRDQSFDGRIQTYEYDANRRCVRITRASGQTIDLKRNLDGNISQIKLNDGSSCSFAYDLSGALTAATNASAELTFERDALGRIIKEQQNDHWIQHSVDLMGHIVATRTDLGFSLNFDFDSNGRWRRVTSSFGDLVDFVRDPTGRELERRFSGNLTLSQSFDEIGRLITQRVLRTPEATGSAYRSGEPTGGSATVSRDYSYDAAQHVTQVVDRFWGSEEFHYDPAGRLLSVSSDRIRKESFEHDDCGNIVRRKDSGSVPHESVFVYGPGNRLLVAGNTRLEFDADGRVIAKSERLEDGSERQWRYRWNALDQLQELVTPEGKCWRYEYDPLFRRVRKSCGEHQVQFIWNGYRVIHELDSRHRQATCWLFDQRALTPLTTYQEGHRFQIISDHIGTPREAIDDSGRVVWRSRATAFGQRAPNDRPSPQIPFSFQGQYADEESGLCCNHFRYYDPSLCRFLSQDPVFRIGLENVYAYVPDPVNWIDPWGATASSGCDGGGWSVPDEVKDKLPESWGEGAPNKKGEGHRWQDPKDPGSGVRVDRGNPDNPQPIQQVDHVVVRDKGVVIGRDGKPIVGSIKENPAQAHIPLSEYLTWAQWNKP